MNIIQCALQHFVGDFARLLHAVHNFMRKYSMIHRCPQIRISDKPVTQCSNKVEVLFLTPLRYFSLALAHPALNESSTMDLL